MKKFVMIALCAAGAATGAFAQEQVLKDAERALKQEAPKYAEIGQSLRAAMADPVTAADVRTWYLAGKAGYGQYNEGFQAMTLGQTPDKKAISHAIVDGFKFYSKALTLDTIREVKGDKVKVKTKYSKDIVKTIADNYQNYYNAGALLYEEKDYAGAYEAWDIYNSLPFMTQLGKSAPAVPADSIMAENLYNMGLFAYNAQMYPEATEAFLRATEYDFPGCDAFNNAIACAGMSGDNERKFEISKLAYQKRGSENAGYVGEIINGYIERKQNDQALVWIDKAIEAEPGNAQLYNAKGILVESSIPEDADAATLEAGNEEALGYYKKAVELEPEGAMWNYHYGRMLANKGYRMSDASADLPTAEYNAMRENEILPIFKQAASYLEKAIAADPESTRNALPMLRNIYYNLNDADNMKRIEDMQ